MFLLNVTRFIRILLILVIVISPYKLFSKNIDLNYDIEWKTLNIAKLIWSANFDDNLYTIKNTILSDGIFSSMYPFELISQTNGTIVDESFSPSHFHYISQSRKKNKSVSIKFDELGLINDYEIIPKPDDFYIDNFNQLKSQKLFTDPISQLFEYFLHQKNSNKTIIDGRRIYDLHAENIEGKTFDENSSINFQGETLGLKITFPYYLSLWKDSKDDKNNIKYVIIYYSAFKNTNIPVQIVLKTNRSKIFMNLSSYNIVN